MSLSQSRPVCVRTYSKGGTGPGFHAVCVCFSLPHCLLLGPEYCITSVSLWVHAAPNVTGPQDDCWAGQGVRAVIETSGAESLSAGCHWFV